MVQKREQGKERWRGEKISRRSSWVLSSLLHGKRRNADLNAGRSYFTK